MSTLRWLAVVVAVGLLGANLRAEEPDLAKLLVGKWVVTKADEGAPPVGTMAEFTKDGKLKVTIKMGDKENVMEGTYKCDANKFICTFKENDKDKTMTHDVTKISKDEMTFSFEGKSVTAKRKS